MDLQLNGKTALITGGSKGIGLATAKTFAAEGVSLHLASRDAGNLKSAKSEIQSEFEVEVTTYSMDLGKTEAIEELASTCGDVDILVNNAGAIAAGTIAAIDEKTWRHGWDLKVFGYINLSRIIFANMTKRGSGVIVNVCGTAGNQHASDHLPATTANAALITLTRAMGGTSLNHGVRVVGVNPGDCLNERGMMFLRRYAEKNLGDAERWEEILKDLPGGKAGTSDDMANTIVFLSSERARYISGEVLTIDGGVSAGRAVI